jgi:hypothetical protein
MPLAFGSRSLDMQIIMGELRKIGWVLVGSRQPPLINLPIDAATDDTVIEPFLSDLRKAAGIAARGGETTRAQLAY